MVETVAERRANRRIYQFLTTDTAKQPILASWALVQFDRQEGLRTVRRHFLDARRFA